MVISKEQQEELLTAAKPLIKWLNENCHPHVKVIIETDRAELLEGVVNIPTEEFIKD